VATRHRKVRYTARMWRCFAIPRDKSLLIALQTLLVLPFAGTLAFSQTGQKSTPAVSSASVERAIDLVAKGQCQEALKVLRKSASRVSDKQLKYSAEMATVRCAMSLNETDTAVQALLVLNREFPNDPQVLYISTHYYSELASKSAQRIASVAPTSYQAHQLEAEALETHEKWDEAAREYQGILEQNPKLPGIHYRLARIALSRPQTPETAQEGKRELEEELRIDPANAAAVFFLGELARQAGQWEQAIARFSKAAELDPGFAEAFLALGMSLNSAQRFQEGVAPLESYVKMLPEDPAGHYQLSIAYARTGRKQDAMREMSIQQELSQKNPGGVPKH
jgi:predicted Zn-dependent protease